MTVIFEKTKSFKIENLWNQGRSVSTLLVPENLVPGLKLRTKEHGNNFSVYFRNLLWMYRTLTHSGLIPRPRKIKTEFQEEGQFLTRINFRPYNADWIELGELSLAFGKSRCWLFTLLLEIDLAGLWDILSEFGMNDAVPTKNNLRLKVTLSLRRVLQDFARSYHVRV